MQYPNETLLEKELSRVPEYHREVARQCFLRGEMFAHKDGNSQFAFYGLLDNPILIHPNAVPQAEGFPAEVIMSPHRLQFVCLAAEGRAYYKFADKFEAIESDRLHHQQFALKRVAD